MSTVTLTLLKPRYAPWGLLTDEETPRMIVWLTEEDPVQEVDSLLLSDWDVARILQSDQAGIIHQEGINDVQLVSAEPQTPDGVNGAVPIPSSIAPKVAPHEMVMDVTQLMRQEAERAKQFEQKVQSRYPKLDELLSTPANQLKKQLKELAKGRTPVSFFQEARKKEQLGKDRKTVISVLTDIIQAKINAVGVDGQANMHTGQTTLSDAYYDMIEEFEEEEEEEILTPETGVFSENLPG